MLQDNMSDERCDSRCYIKKNGGKVNNTNYQKELDKIIENTTESKKVLLHSCCAPCSSYVLEYLTKYFELGVLYYNPNISPEDEYTKRVKEQKGLIEKMPLQNKVTFIEGCYEPKKFYELVKGLEKCPEGAKRCFLCYEMRLREAAKYAKELGYDYFTTTLTISPLKNAGKINEIGKRIAGEYQVTFLPSDFKKRNGYKRSIELSKEYELYRQDYCGCIFSKKERMKDDEEK